MNWIPSKVGAEPKKIAALAVLGAIAIGVYLLNRTPGGESSAPARPAVAAVTHGAPGAEPRPVGRAAMRVTQSGVGRAPQEFHPSMKIPKDMDPSEVDPTLHLAALARLHDVKMDGTSRSLFEISATPPVELAVKEPGPIKIVKAFVLYGPKAPPPPPPPPPTPRDGPIQLKFYGFVNPARPDIKRAFFFDPSNEDILIAGEGDLIKKRYKVLRIGINSAEVEDTQFKGDNTKQTLPLEKEETG